ncbi:MAG: flavodoxin family protein [Clostridia bacterium]|nr:flavodoxin family protein [Clostridia bacterium]
MKVLLLNGSPRGEKCTYTALKTVAEELEKNDIKTEIVNIGKNPIQGCIGCGACGKTGKGCAFGSDGVNDFIEKMKEADGLVIGSPVHYASASGAVTSFMDRVSYAGGSAMAFKPGAAVVSCRRGGASVAFDQLNKYFSILNMPVVSSNYWNMVHGSTPEEVLQDEEGIQTMRILGRNMAWLIKAIDFARKNGIEHLPAEKKIKTNYIR